MAVQTQVGVYFAPAVAGDRATNNPMVYTAYNPIARGDVIIGNFAFAGDYSFFEAKSSSDDEEALPLGIVERIQYQYIYNVLEDATMTIPEGGVVTIVRKGDMWVKPTTAMAAGDKVHARASDGAIGTEGVETDFIVKFYDTNSGMAVISNWDANTVADKA